MIHEVLLSLVGHAGNIVVDTGSTFELAPGLSFLSQPEVKSVNEICGLGYHFSKLERYCRAQLELVGLSAYDAFLTGGNVPAGKETPNESEALPKAHPPGLYLRSFVAGINKVLDEYRNKVLELERSVLSDPSLPLSFLNARLQDYQHLFPLLSGLVDTVSADGLRGGQLLDQLRKHSFCGIDVVQKTMTQLLENCHLVTYKQVSAWVVHGLLIDPYDEFFVKCIEAEDAAVNLYSAEQGADSKKDWMVDYYINVEMLPSYIPLRVAEKIAFSGKAVQILTHPLIGRDTALLADDDVIELRQIIEQAQRRETFNLVAFECAVDSIRSKVAHKLWRLVVEEKTLLGHVRAMKEYFLLAKGDFYHQFIQDSRTILAAPPGPTAEQDANKLFQAALKTLADDDSFFRRFHFKLTPSTSQREGGDAAKRPLDLWKGLRLHYDFEWPLHLLLTQEVFDKYNDVFHFLLSVRRVQCELQRAWKPLKEFKKERNRAEQAKLMPATRLRSHMGFVIDNLLFYLQVDVLDTLFSELENAINNSTDFEEIQLAHTHYLSEMVTRCFLMKKDRPILRALEEVLHLCYTFSGRLVADGVNISPEIVSSTAQSFSRQYGFLYTILSGKQASSYLAQLLLRFDFNQNFSLSTYRLRSINS